MNEVGTKAQSDRTPIEIIAFGYRTREDKRLLRQFVDFHWGHYENDPQYIPLLDYEYLGFGLLGIRGFFEPVNLFFKHADMRFFLAKKDGRIVGRCNAFVNRNHNRHWNDKVGFFGSSNPPMIPMSAGPSSARPKAGSGGRA